MTQQNTAQLLITIAVITLGTLLTRTLPFFLFPSGKETPASVRYLGTVLPCASIGMLVVYCFKNVTFLTGSRGLPELLAAAFVIIVHKKRHNLLLSIAGGTILYMILVQAVF